MISRMPLPLLYASVASSVAFLVAEHRVQRGHDADGRLHVAGEHLASFTVMPSTHWVRNAAIDVLEQVLRLDDRDRVRAARRRSAGAGRCARRASPRGRCRSRGTRRCSTTSGIDRVHLARHDRRAGLERREVDLVEPGARTGGEQDQVARDLRELDRELSERPRSRRRSPAGPRSRRSCRRRRRSACR